MPLNGRREMEQWHEEIKDQEPIGSSFQDDRDLGIIFGKKRASQWRWLMCLGSDEIVDEKVVEKVGWH